MKQFNIWLNVVCFLLLMGLGACEKEMETVKEPLTDNNKIEEVSDTSNYKVSLTEVQAFGINYNGQLDFVDYDNLQRTQTTWVRGFVDFFQFYNDPSKLDTDVRIQNYLTLKDNGYKTILNIKWDFKGKGLSMPAVGSQEMTDYKNFLTQVLNKVWNKTDIIVVGNEPFIETPIGERDQRLVDFYKEIAKKVKNYRTNQTKNDTPIFLGAINNLYQNSLRTQAVVDLLAFVKEKNWISGIDLHIHHSAIEDITGSMDYVNTRIRDDQKILVTEFSLMKHWKLKLQENIPSNFAQEYGRNTNWKNYQYIDYALKNPVSRPEWVAFLQNSYWFENRKFYLSNAYDLMTGYNKFYIATYGIRQSYPYGQDFTANTDPWVLNALYVNRSVVLNPSTGQEQFNYAFIDDFRAIQNMN
ncbi:hypothetical protein V6R21_01910 [Limibacter armeniacum]|uniref:hypothetical protein n=1 Tax=Limibacter armeniacum TaxID=466084 RepID=UPI002FE5346F